MDLAEIKTGIKRYGFDDTDPLLTWANAALGDIELAFDWPWLKGTQNKSTIAGAQSMSLDPVAKINKVYLGMSGSTQRTFLPYTTVEEFEDLDSGVGGPPQVWTSQDMTYVNLWPTPDTVYQVRLYVVNNLPPLVNDTDVPELPDAMHYAIITGAAAKGLMAENEETRAATAQAEFDTLIEKSINKYGELQGSALHTVKDVQGYGGW